MDAPDDAPSSGRARHDERPSPDDGMMNNNPDNQSRTNTSNTAQPKQLIDYALAFLSTCSNESLLIVVVCLMGVTYIVLGRLGLLLIGAALGVALHASWEGTDNIQASESRGSNRKEVSLNAIHRLLEWERNKRSGMVQSERDAGKDTVEDRSRLDVDIDSFGPLTVTALHSLIDAAVRDYVNYWYEPILPSESTFPNSCREILTGFTNSVSSHLHRKRTADTFLQFLTNSSSMIIVFLNELCAAFEAAGPTVSAEEAVLQYLESNPEGSLSSLLAQQQQSAKLQIISDDILSRYLDSGAYNCIPVRNFLREILSGVVLESSITSMSRPEFINSWITYLFSEGESEIMSAIDAGVEGARNQGVTAGKVSGESTRSAAVSADESSAELDPSSRDSGQASSQLDQATEEAMLETKRLSAMIASQNPSKHVEQMVHGDVGGSNSAKDVEDTVTDPDAIRSVRESSDKGFLAEADSARGNQEGQGAVNPSELGSSLNSPLPQSPGISTNSASDTPEVPSPSTLYHASITVDDSLDSRDGVVLRSKPTSEYLIQVEPQSGRSSGWMVFKKYADFESIHETLGTIARLNGLRFGDSHPIVPPWKGQTRQALARGLEQYLQDALQLEPLAESVTMRRFLGKDRGPGSESVDPTAKPGFAFPGQTAFENVGKGVLGVLTNAPKGVSGGGKAVLDGVTGVFGGGANKRTSTISDGDKKKNQGAVRNASSLEVDKSEFEQGSKLSSDTTDSALPSRLPDSQTADGLASPSEIASFTESSNTPVRTPESEENNEADSRVSSDPASAPGNSATASVSEEKTTGSGVNNKSTGLPAGWKGQSSPITGDETQMAVELIFAVINELYSLSSAWNIRRTLLNAAKSYILRPGNPSLETIRGLLQESMIDNHTTDEAVGVYLSKLRENALPTAEELSAWPPEMSEVEKVRQREAARRVLVQKGLPQAITSVMGAAASREALGKVFDSLQVHVVARGFVFSILLQALRAIVL